MKKIGEPGIGNQNLSVSLRNEKHCVGMPVSAVIAQVALPRKHIAHRARFQGGQFVLVKSGFDGVKNLSFGLSGQNKFDLFDNEWKKSSSG